jgi:uncharacterized RDD family membrane protein YckC
MENKNFVVTDDLLASHSQRFLNFIIDLIIQYIILLSIGTIIVLIADIIGNYELSENIKRMNIIEQSLFGIIIGLFYYIMTEAYFSRSIAKYFTKTIVLTKEGTKPDSKTIFIRSFCRLIPIDAFTFLGTVPRGWHDKISGTYVVKKHPFVEKKGLV